MIGQSKAAELITTLRCVFTVKQIAEATNMAEALVRSYERGRKNATDKTYKRFIAAADTLFDEVEDVKREVRKLR